MSDEDLRRELRETLGGNPSRRRLVELSRLASALAAVDRSVNKFRGITTDPLLRSPITVGAARYIQKLLADSSVLGTPRLGLLFRENT